MVRNTQTSKVHEATCKGLAVSEKLQDATEGNRFVRMLVSACLGDYESSFFFSQPASFLWKICQGKEGHEANQDSRNALEDEDPSPGMITTVAVHLRDSTCKKPTEHVGHDHRAEIEGETLLSFLSFIPAADNVEA